jgi:trehalose synthase
MATLSLVQVDPKQLADYAPVVGQEVIEELRKLAEPLRGARVLHINATAYGGGVAEILHTLVPLTSDLGLNAEWRAIAGSNEFFNVTKAMHNGLQGMALPFTDEMRYIWQRYNEQNAHSLEGEYDFVIVHDPQPAGLLYYHGRSALRVKQWIWRCHIDTSTPNMAYWTFLLPYLEPYDAHIFTMQQYVGPRLQSRRLAIVAPTIDPLSPKNLPMRVDMAQAILSRYNVDTLRPLLVQVSRFDPWKDPLGVIDAYRMVKREIPRVQLALPGSMASDDPEGWFFYDKVLRHVGEDQDIIVLHNLHGVGDKEINAVQTLADVVIQKSTREGFGLTVTEALWKGKPVIGGNVGGIPLQVLDGETGYLVDSVESCATRCLELLLEPDQRQAMGQAGREHVRRNYLTTRLVRDDLNLFRALSASP